MFIIDAAQGGAAAARGGAKEGAVDALTRKTGMSMEEACQILNITKEADLEKLTKVKCEKGWDHGSIGLTMGMCVEL